MVIVGDRIRLRLMKGSERVGVVTGITGTMLRVRWAPNEESTVIPGPGTLTVLGRATRKASPPRKQTTAAAKKATSKNTPSKRPAAKGGSPTKKVAPKKAAKKGGAGAGKKAATPKKASTNTGKARPGSRSSAGKRSSR